MYDFQAQRAAWMVLNNISDSKKDGDIESVDDLDLLYASMGQII